MTFPALPQAVAPGSLDIEEWCRVMAAHPHSKEALTFDKSRGILNSYLRSEGVWTCPSAPDMVTAYGANYNLVVERVALGHPPLLSQIQVPAETIMAADYSWSATANFSWEDGAYVFPPSSHSPLISGRHFGRANVLWFDGHVSARKPVASYPIPGRLSVQQLQQLSQGDILKTAYSGNAAQDDYYYNLSKSP